MRQARRASPEDVDPAATLARYVRHQSNAKIKGLAVERFQLAGGGGGSDRDREEDAAGTGAVTIGQALRAVVLSPAGDRPLDHADAAAVQALEKSVTGQGGAVAVPGGVAAVAQRAAETNEEARGHGGEDGKAGDASAVVPGDRAATFVDAEKVAAASSTREGGAGMGEVADAVAAAAQMNEGEGPPL